MPPGNLTLPFVAVHGMEDAKRALLCACVNPRIRTVLVRGGPGTAKTVLARSLGDLIGRRVVNIPMNATEDQVFGGMDVESAIREGRPVVRGGILSEASGCVVYLDEANLMDRRMLSSILDCVSSGRVLLEREGVSGEYPVDCILVASMDPSDSDLSPHLLDRFDLCAYSDEGMDGRGREEVARRNLDFLRDPDGFASLYSEETEELRSKVSRARDILPIVVMPDGLAEVCVELSMRVSADGLRGDIATVNAAMAIAALNGRDEVLRKDVEEAAMISLAHRRNYLPEPPPEPPGEQPDADRGPQDDTSDDGCGDPGGQEDGRSDVDGRHDDGQSDGAEGETAQDPGSVADDIIFEIGEQFRVIDYTGQARTLKGRISSRRGRRAMAENADMTGRYARAREPDGRVADLALDATLRAAAPYQRSRDRNGLAVAVERRDIRVKVRERRSGCTVLYLVDASGSLGVRRRMAAVKGAVLSMLRDGYVKRDRVGLMAFRRDSAELILPPTRSVEYGYRRLEELPTGGRTPLGEALVTAGEYMTSYVRSHQGEECYVVVITDGRANVPLKEGSDATEEVGRLASDLKVPGVRWIVIDAAAGHVRFDDARKLAESLEGTYFRLEDLNADRLAETVRAAMG